MSLGDSVLDIQGAGAMMSALSTFAGGFAQKAALRGQADVAEINAATSELTARSAMLAGQHEEQRSMIATANLKSKQTTAFAANGIDIGEGSAARTLASTDVMGEIDKNTIAANAVRAAWGYRTQGVNQTMEANSKRSQADAISPVMNTATSLLTSAGSVAKDWYVLNKAGALDRYAQPVGG